MAKDREMEMKERIAEFNKKKAFREDITKQVWL